MQRNSPAPFSSNSDSLVSSGLVVTLNQDPSRRLRAIAEISAHPAIRIAAVKDRWLPVAVDARDEEETERIHHWITSLDGVEVADVVSIGSLQTVSLQAVPIQS